MGLRGGNQGKKGTLTWINSLSTVHVTKEIGERDLKWETERNKMLSNIESRGVYFVIYERKKYKRSSRNGEEGIV